MPTGEQRERNRERVVQAAMACLLEGGIEAVQLRGVARRAGVAVRSVERYFHGRYDLLEATGVAIAHNAFNDLRVYVATAAFQALNGRAQLLAILRQRLEHCLRQHERVIGIIELEVYAFRHGKSRSLFRRLRASLRDVEEVTKGCIEKGLRDGSIKLRVPRQKLLDTLVVDFNGFIMRLAFLQAEEKQGDKVRRRHARAMLRGIEAMLTGDDGEVKEGGHAPDDRRP